LIAPDKGSAAPLLLPLTQVPSYAEIFEVTGTKRRLYLGAL
jgi:hypothetical protein